MLPKGAKVRIDLKRDGDFTFKGHKPRYSKDTYEVIGNDFNLAQLRNEKTGSIVEKKWSRHRLNRIDKSVEKDVKSIVKNEILRDIKVEPQIKKEVINLVENEIQKIIKEVKNKKNPSKNTSKKSKKNVDDIIGEIRRDKKLAQKKKKITFARTQNLPKESYTVNENGVRRSTRVRRKPVRYGFD